MSLPLRQEIRIPSGDVRRLRFQILEGGNKTASNLMAQTLIFYIKQEGNGDFTPIEKNIVNEGWFVDNANKEFEIVIDTDAYSMSIGEYQAEIEWEDKKASLVFMNISIYTDIRH